MLTLGTARGETGQLIVRGLPFPYILVRPTSGIGLLVKPWCHTLASCLLIGPFFRWYLASRIVTVNKNVTIVKKWAVAPAEEGDEEPAIMTSVVELTGNTTVGEEPLSLRIIRLELENAKLANRIRDLGASQGPGAPSELVAVDPLAEDT